MTEVEIEPGNCSFNTLIKTKKIDKMELEIELNSECPHIQKVDTKDWSIDYAEEFSKKLHDTKIYKDISTKIPHISCPIYTAVLKAVEVELGMALPQNIEIKFKDNQ